MMPRILDDAGRSRPDPEPPMQYVRCLLCGDVVERGWFDIHTAEECDIAGFETL